MIINELIKDEKKINRKLYSSGKYWFSKNKKILIEIKKKDLNNFRGINSGVGTSFSDNLVFDTRNELNILGRTFAKILSLPILNKIFDSQLNITKEHINSLIKNQSIVFKNSKEVLNLIGKYKFENTTEFGCINQFEYLNKNYSCHYLKTADRIDKLSKYFNFKNIKNFFEIGGGFGANIHFLLTNFPNIKKIIYLDVVPNIFVGTTYLKYFFGKNVKDYIELRNLNKITFSKDDQLEILCIPPWLIERVNVEIDHFHNAASFVEMPKEVIKNYVKFIKKFKAKEISLISYHFFDPNTTFNPEELNEFFENKLKISYKNDLIEESNRKWIYLTSK